MSSIFNVKRIDNGVYQGCLMGNIGFIKFGKSFSYFGIQIALVGAHVSYSFLMKAMKIFEI